MPANLHTPVSSDETLTALTSILAAAARASTSADTPEAISESLRQALDADVIAVELNATADRPRCWRAHRGRVSTDGAAFRHDAANEAPEALHDVTANGGTTFLLSGGAGVLGTLRVVRHTPLTAADDLLVRACADILVVGVARDERMQDLEREITARVREVAEQRAFIERVVDSLPFGLYVVDREYRIHAWNHKRETGLQGVSRRTRSGARSSKYCIVSPRRC